MSRRRNEYEYKTGRAVAGLRLIGARGTSFMFNKLVLSQMGPMTLMGMRFLLAFAVLALIFFRHLRKACLSDILKGAALGAAFYLVMAAELIGLTMCDSGLAALLENTALVMVPLFVALGSRRLPDGTTLFCSLMILIGVACLAWSPSGFSFGLGEVIMLAAAVLYALTIILTERLAGEGDTVVMGIIQVGVIGALGMAAAFVAESPAPPADVGAWVCILVLAFVCSGFGFTLQPVAQKYLTAERAGMFCAVGPLVATVMGVVFLHEQFSPAGAAGILLVLAGLLLAGLPGRLELYAHHSRPAPQQGNRPG